MSGKRPADSPPDGEPNEKKVMSQMSSSLPQVRLGTIGSEEELNTKIEEFATKRLKELLDSETKLRKEAEERAQTAQNKLTENKGRMKKVRRKKSRLIMSENSCFWPCFKKYPEKCFTELLKDGGVN